MAKSDKTKVVRKPNQSKRPAEDGPGFLPEHKRANSPAPGHRARSLEFNSHGAGPSRLAQSTIDSYVSPAGCTSDKAKGGQGGKQSTNLPPAGAQADPSAFPSLPGAPPPPISGIKFPELPARTNPAVLGYYKLMCSMGVNLQGQIERNEEFNMSDLVDGYIHTCAALGAFMGDFYKQQTTFAEVVKSQKGIEKELNSVQTNAQTEQAKHVFEDDNSVAQLSLHLPRGQQILPGLMDDLQDEKGRPAGVALLEDFWQYIEEKSSLVNLGPFHKGMVVNCFLKRKPERGNQPAAAMLTIECSDRRAKQRIQQLIRRKVDLKNAAGDKSVPLLRKIPPAHLCSTTVLDARLRHR